MSGFDLHYMFNFEIMFLYEKTVTKGCESISARSHDCDIPGSMRSGWSHDCDIPGSMSWRQSGGSYRSVYRFKSVDIVL